MEIFQEKKENVRKNYLALFQTPADVLLAEKYHFPYPFLRERVKVLNVYTRNEIDKSVMGFKKKISTNNIFGEEVDCYVFDMGDFGDSLVYFIYDKNGKLVRVDESGSAFLLK